MAEDTGAEVRQGWYEDPSHRHAYRWFSQGKPTDLVKDGTVTAHDPMTIAGSDLASKDLQRPTSNVPLRPPGPSVPLARYRLKRDTPWGLLAIMGAFVLLGGGLTWGFWKWTAPSCAPSAAASYLAKGPTNVVYVQWHQPSSSKTITGAISLVSLWGKPPAEHMSVESHHFTGQLLACSGPGNISITMRINDLSLKDSLAGAFQDGKLVLHDESEPTLSGAIYIMVRSDPAAYNAAVRTLAAKRLRANKEALVRRA